MCQTETPPTPDESTDQLSDEERELFKRLANHYDNEVGRVFEIALRSSTDNEEANS